MIKSLLDLFLIIFSTQILKWSVELIQKRKRGYCKERRGEIKEKMDEKLEAVTEAMQKIEDKIRKAPKLTMRKCGYLDVPHII